MTKKEFDSIAWKKGMYASIKGFIYDILSIDFECCCIEVEGLNEWVSYQDITEVF